MAYVRRPPAFRLASREDASPPATRKAVAPPKAIRGAGAIMVARLAQRTRFVDPGLVAKWPDLAGDEIAAISRPGKLSAGRADRQLDVFVSDGAAASLVQFNERALVDRLNAYFGPGVIGRVRVRMADRETIAGNTTDDRKGSASSSGDAATKPSGLGRFLDEA